MDIRQICSFADYFVICSADSGRQIEAVANEISTQLKKQGASQHHSEGDADSGWLLLDWGVVIIHIFSPEKREYYDLDIDDGEEINDKACSIYDLAESLPDNLSNTDFYDPEEDDDIPVGMLKQWDKDIEFTVELRQRYTHMRDLETIPLQTEIDRAVNS